MPRFGGRVSAAVSNAQWPIFCSCEATRTLPTTTTPPHHHHHHHNSNSSSSSSSSNSSSSSSSSSSSNNNKNAIRIIPFNSSYVCWGKKSITEFVSSFALDDIYSLDDTPFIHFRRRMHYCWASWLPRNMSHRWQRFIIRLRVTGKKVLMFWWWIYNYYSR